MPKYFFVTENLSTITSDYHLHVPFFQDRIDLTLLMTGHCPAPTISVLRASIIIYLSKVN